MKLSRSTTIAPKRAKKELGVIEESLTAARESTDGAKLIPDLGFLRLYAFAYGIGTWQQSFAMTQNTQLSGVYQQFFGWDDDELTFWQTFLNCTSSLGMIIGSLVGTNIIKYGRKRCLILI